MPSGFLRSKAVTEPFRRGVTHGPEREIPGRYHEKRLEKNGMIPVQKSGTNDTREIVPSAKKLRFRNGYSQKKYNYSNNI